MKTLLKIQVTLVLFVMLNACAIAITTDTAQAENTTSASNSQPATASLSMPGGSYEVGSTIPVVAYIDSGATAVYAFQFDLSYDSEFLQFVSVDASSKFHDYVSPSGGNGSVRVTRLVVPLGSSISGKSSVAVVNFKALSKTGTTQVSFSSQPGSAIGSASGNIWDGNPNGAIFTINSPSATVFSPINKPKAPQPVAPAGSPAPRSIPAETEANQPKPSLIEVIAESNLSPPPKALVQATQTLPGQAAVSVLAFSTLFAAGAISGTVPPNPKMAKLKDYFFKKR